MLSQRELRAPSAVNVKICRRMGITQNDKPAWGTKVARSGGTVSRRSKWRYPTLDIACSKASSARRPSRSRWTTASAKAFRPADR